MEIWQSSLKVDPVSPLLTAKNEALLYFVRRDLLAESVGAVEPLWSLREPVRLLRQQLENGAWKYPGGGRSHLRPTEDYNQIRTYRILGILVEKYAFNRRHPAIKKAAEYLFSRQTAEGDFRGIYGNQYTPNYSAAIMELLIKAGYEADLRIARGFRWLLSVRQQDGGWAIPLRTVGKKFDAETLGAEAIRPDPAQPSAHLVTGIVLRAFAAHRDYAASAEARAAGALLASRLFAADRYRDRQASRYWTAFSFPFWNTDLLSALDSLSQLGLSADDPQIRRALRWFQVRQGKDGIWVLTMLRSARKSDRHLWHTLAICRVFKRFASS